MRYCLVLLIILTASIANSADGCIEYITTIFNTSGDCTATPSIDRILGLDIVNWNGSTYLVGDIGNELRLWNIDTPLTPIQTASSGFAVDTAGDSDYDLINFSVCDECRFGVTNHKQESVLFDLGTGQTPRFLAHRHYSDADFGAGFTFKHAGQQYLLASKFPNACAGGATLYLFNGINSHELIKIGCLVNSLGNGLGAANGVYYQDVNNTAYLYVISGINEVGIFKVDDSGTTLRLVFLGSPMRGFSGYGRGFRVDRSNHLAVGTTWDHVEIWDIYSPDVPQFLVQIPRPGIYPMQRVAVAQPYLFYASQYTSVGYLANVEIPSNPDPFNLDSDYWVSTRPWNTSNCDSVNDGIIASDGTTLYLARYSVLQVVDISQCVESVEEPLFADGFESGNLNAWNGG